MSVVVSDTSPLRCLAHLDLLYLVPEIFEDVLIPPAVAFELENPEGRFQPVHVASLPGVRVVGPSDAGRVQRFRTIERLDPGESEALALALEVRANEVLIDEDAGRRVARTLGITPIGVLGALVRGKQRGLVGEVVPLMDRLKSGLNFYISPELRAEIVRLAGE